MEIKVLQCHDVSCNVLQFDVFTCIHKHYSPEEWAKFADENPTILKNVAVSSGSGDVDYTKLSAIIKAVPSVQYICLDVANGYSEHFVDFVRRTRKDFPNHTIIVSTVLYELDVHF